MMRHVTHLLWVVISCCLLPLHVSAEVQTITVTGEYRIGAYDTLPEGQRLALVAAKSRALEQALAYLDTVPAVKQLGLNREELRAYSSGLLRIKQDPSHTTRAEAATTVSVPVTLMLDPAVVTHQLESVMQNERAKTELILTREKIDAYQKELDKDQRQLAASKNKEDAKFLLQHRGDILMLMDTEEQLAHTWTSVLDMREGTYPEGSAKQETGAQNKNLPRTPDNAEEHRKKGALLTQQGHYDEALAEFRLALHLMPDLDRAHLGLGAALQGKGDLEGAIAEYRMLLKRHPNDPAAHNNLGSALQQKGDIGGAISEYRTALQSQPDDPLTHYNLGTALSTKGQLDEALGEYRTAIRLNPDLLQAYFDLGSLLKESDQARDAADAFREYVRRAPNTSANQPWIKQAQAYLEKTRKRQLEQGGRQNSGS
jgi:tetratricopeptide (TPR) repeat protein